MEKTVMEAMIGVKKKKRAMMSEMGKNNNNMPYAKEIAEQRSQRCEVVFLILKY